MGGAIDKIKLASSPLLIGGHVKNTAEAAVNLDCFLNYAEGLCQDGRDDALIKFGKLPSENGAEPKLVLRIASVKHDGWYACDVKDALFRTKATKEVNNSVRKTFINSLVDKYKDVDLKTLSDEALDKLHLEDFIGESAHDLLHKAENFGKPFRLSELAAKMETQGTGKPISAREIIDLAEVIGTSEQAGIEPDSEVAQAENWRGYAYDFGVCLSHFFQGEKDAAYSKMTFLNFQISRHYNATASQKAVGRIFSALTDYMQTMSSKISPKEFDEYINFKVSSFSKELQSGVNLDPLLQAIREKFLSVHARHINIAD